MKIYTKILIIVITIILIFKSVSSCVSRMSVQIKSVSFSRDDNKITLGNNDIPVPELGDGMYALAFNRTIYGVKHRMIFIGVLKINTYEKQLIKMDEFFTDCINDGLSYICIFSIGKTHEKPVLEILRTGISFGELEDILYIFKKYGIKKFTSFSHGVKKPYIFIKNMDTNKTIERTGSTGGILTANL